MLGPLERAGFELGPMQVGLHIALIANEALDDRALSRALTGQRLVALSSLCLQRTDCYGFALGFTNGTGKEIAAAATSLTAALLR